MMKNNKPVGSKKVQIFHLRCKTFSFFTLIELLVTISIIIILVSMLLPGLNKARESAKEAKCKGNMKQINTITMLYSNDYDDCLPVSYYASTQQPAWSMFTVLNYVQSTKIYDCPSDITRTPSTNAIASRNGDYYNYSWHKGNNQGYLWWFCYGYDKYGLPLQPAQKISKLKKIQFDFFAVDAETQLSDMPFYYALGGQYYLSTTGLADWTRHNKGANFGIADGSVKKIDYYNYMKNYRVKGDY